MSKPPLKHLPLSAYTFLDKMGMLYELYSEATGDWKFDCPSPKPLPKAKYIELADGIPK